MQNHQLDRPDFSGFTRRNAELRQKIAVNDLHQLAQNSGGVSNLEQNTLELIFWKRSISIAFPEIQIIDQNTKAILPDFTQAMILNYLLTADGTPGSGDWISFSDLPDGKFYQRAFQGYTGHELARQIGSHLEGFVRVAEEWQAHKIQFAHAAYIFQALPRVPLLVVYWQGDDDFPASFQILFDRSAPHYLPTDAYAILGSMLTRKIMTSYHSIFS